MELIADNGPLFCFQNFHQWQDFTIFHLRSALPTAVREIFFFLVIFILFYFPQLFLLVGA